MKLNGKLLMGFVAILANQTAAWALAKCNFNIQFNRQLTGLVDHLSSTSNCPTASSGAQLLCQCGFMADGRGVGGFVKCMVSGSSQTSEKYVAMPLGAYNIASGPEPSCHLIQS